MTQLPASADVIVIGAGIAGTATAWYLAQRGVKVVVCEKGRIAGEQSSRNWGFVRQQGRDPAEIPLMQEANRIWRGLERELNADLEWRADGNLVAFRNEQERTAFERWVVTANDLGLDSRIVDQAEIQRLVPGTTLGQHGGIFTASDGKAEPTKVTAAMARSAEARGATFVENCAVLEVIRQGGKVSGVRTEHGEIGAPVVVLASGAWSSKMLKHLGFNFRQLWVLGSVGNTMPVEKVSGTAVWAGVAMRQREDGSINFALRSADTDLTVQALLHARSFLKLGQDYAGDYKFRLRRIFAGTALGHFSQAALERELKRYRVLDPEPNPAAIREGLKLLQQAYPTIGEVKLRRSWAGYIELTPDLLPTIEAMDTPKGLIIATGFSGHGFGMGPITGKIVADLITEGQSDHDLKPFRFNRFDDGSEVKIGTAV